MLHSQEEKITKMTDFGAKVYVRWSIKQIFLQIMRESSKNKKFYIRILFISRKEKKAKC